MINRYRDIQESENKELRKLKRSWRQRRIKNQELKIDLLKQSKNLDTEDFKIYFDKVDCICCITEMRDNEEYSLLQYKNITGYLSKISSGWKSEDEWDEIMIHLMWDTYFKDILQENHLEYKIMYKGELL